MRAILAAVLIGAAAVTPAVAGDPVGHYAVTGTNPGGHGTYDGEAEVTRTGDTLKVVWVIAGRKYVGTGIGDAGFFAVSYRCGNAVGLALYGPKGDDWEGVWTYANGTEIGTEHWTRN